jgi:hypothetical protein
MSDAPKLNPEDVEAAITAAGREDVFAEMRRLGWGAEHNPPLWVWNIVANQVAAGEAGRTT